MELHQLVHTLSYGDAISGEVLSLQRCFRSLGLVSEIFAINVHPRLKGLARDYRELKPDFSGEALLHFSLGSPLSDLYLKLGQARRSLVFHNLTGAHWFDGVNPRVAADIRAGERELPVLCRASHRLIADSRFNAGELKALGFTAVVLELPMDLARWELPKNGGIDAIVRSEPGIHLLHVGRLAPNKCVEDIIKVFYFLHHKIAPQSRLWLAGIDIDTELYSFSLKRMADEFDLADAINFVGCLDDAELKALYEAASVYLCMSEHEGFCMPLIESMHFGLPVIAFGATAVPDTVGAGGIVVTEKRHPEIAELIQQLHANQGLRTRVIEAGHRRAAELSFERFAARVKEIFS